MKKYFIIVVMMWSSCPFLFSQSDKTKYPEPEFSNEVYGLKKDSSNSVIRLEKSSSKVENKMKIIGHSENIYSIDGERSPIRFSSGSNFSFVLSKNTMKNMDDEFDPSSLTLYKASSEKHNRKISLVKVGGYFSSGKNKLQAGDKIEFTVKEIRNGYWELVVDKPLSKGEYAFAMTGEGESGMDNTTLFSFGVD